MNHYPIFVYGTLMRGEAANTFLAAASIRCLPARLPNARLYSTGEYPIAVDCNHTAPGRALAIEGEVHWLQVKEYSTLLANLDAYEGDEYQRLLRFVELVETGSLTRNAHQLIEAWVYLGDAAYAAQYPTIPSGNWRKRVAHVSH